MDETVEILSEKKLERTRCQSCVKLMDRSFDYNTTKEQLTHAIQHFIQSKTFLEGLNHKNALTEGLNHTNALNKTVQGSALTAKEERKVRQKALQTSLNGRAVRSLQEHFRRCFPNSKLPDLLIEPPAGKLRCLDICCREVISEKNWALHIYQHLLKDELPRYTCSACHKGSATLKPLIAHYDKVHPPGHKQLQDPDRNNFRRTSRRDSSGVPLFDPESVEKESQKYYDHTESRAEPFRQMTRLFLPLKADGKGAEMEKELD